jgi:hypothetical protein
MRGEMKFMKRKGTYESSNVSFDPEYCRAHSYGWWRFVDQINGKVIFNNHSYSMSTCRHQSKVRNLLGKLGIEIDFFINARSGIDRLGNWKKEAIEDYNLTIAGYRLALDSPRRKKALDEERLIQLNKLTQERERLVSFINTIQE